MADPTPASSPLNLPNFISIARLFSVPVAVWLILEGRFLAAFWLFIAAGISDALDGFLAKQFNARTRLGGYLDPIADKMLLVSVYITLGVQLIVPNWLVILIVSRDILIVGGSLLMLILTEEFEVDPLYLSKVNTAAQIVLAGWLLAELGFELSAEGIGIFLVWLVAGTTFLSGLAYFTVWWRRVFASFDEQ